MKSSSKYTNHFVLSLFFITYSLTTVNREAKFLAKILDRSSGITDVSSLLIGNKS